MTRSPLRPMFERLAYFCYLVLFVGSCGGSWLGLLAGWQSGDFTPVVMGLGGLGASAWVHNYGYAHWHFRECEESLSHGISEDGAWPSPAGAVEVEKLFARLAAEPDVWLRGELRRELSARLAANPGLRTSFAEELAGHPEL